jgi:DNA-binding transcriptional ArsR family regulator
MGKPEHPDIDRLLAELRHPLRRELLRLAIEEKEPISPRDLARKVERPLSNVAYHVRVLALCGGLEMVRKTPSRGSIQHFYRAAVTPEQGREALRQAEEKDEDAAGEEIS